MPTTAPTVDFLDARTFANGHPYPAYTWLREHDPVHWHAEPQGPGFWVVTRWEDIRWVNAHDDLFAHAPSSVIEGEVNVGEFCAMVNLDGTEHARVRRMTVPDFVPGSVRRRMPSFADAARDIVREVRAQGECDAAEHFAGRMASYVTGDLLGIPRPDAVRLYEYVAIALAGGGAHTIEERQQASAKLGEYAVGVWEDRRARPTDDVSSHLANGVGQSAGLELGEFCANFALLVVGAGDTTRHLIAGGLLALFEWPEQRRLLESDLDGLLPRAVEEMLRWVTPVVYNRRTALADCERQGRRIRAGDKVVVYYGAGNRDPEQFADPDRFDILRNSNPHLAFSGQGPHFCLGAHVARAEAVAMLRVLLTELPGIRLAGDVTFEDSNQVMGPAALPVAWDV